MATQETPLFTHPTAGWMFRQAVQKALDVKSRLFVGDGVDDPAYLLQRMSTEVSVLNTQSVSITPHLSHIISGNYAGSYEYPNATAKKSVDAFIRESHTLSLPVMSMDVTIEGEGTQIGSPCLLVRLAGCAVRCVGCDTPHSWNVTSECSTSYEVECLFEEIQAKCMSANIRRVSITGGEPLHYIEGMRRLLAMLHCAGFQVNLETSGVVFDPIIFALCHVSVDIKTPSSRVALNVTQVDVLHAILGRDYPGERQVKAIVSDEADIQFLLNTFGNMLSANAHRNYTPICITPWADKSYAEVDNAAISKTVALVLRTIGCSNIRIVAQQHKLLDYI